MLASARSRAGKAGVDFDLTADDVVIPENCPALGIPLAKGVGVAHDGSPSLDRIRPELGYVKGNVRVISRRANAIKHNATVAELEAVTSYLKAALQGRI